MKGKIFFSGTILFLIFFLIGLFTINDYGISWDEPENFNMGRVYLNVIAFRSLKFLYDPYVNNPELLPIKPAASFRPEPHFERYPPIANTLASFLSLILSEKLHLFHTVPAHHLATVLFGAVAVFFTFLITVELTGSVWAGLISGLILAFYPQFLGQSRINIKDVPVLTFLLITLFFIIRYVKFNRFIDIILTGFFWGLAISTKITAISILPVIVFWIILTKGRKLIKINYLIKYSLTILFIIFVALLISFIAWPLLWSNPLTKLQLIKDHIDKVGYYMPVVFGGKIYYAGVNLPWYYALVMTALVTPLGVLSVFCVGLLIELVNLIRKKSNLLVALPLIWLITVYLRYIPSRMVLYNGIRQFLEIAPIISISVGISIWSMYNFLKKFLSVKLLNLFIALVSIIIVAEQIIINIKIHPYQTVYYNQLVGGLRGASDNFEFDYWGFSIQEMVNYLNTQSDMEHKLFAVYALNFLGDYFPKNHLYFVNTDLAKDYILIPHANGLFNGARDYWFNHGNLIYTVKKGGADIGYVFATKK